MKPVTINGIQIRFNQPVRIGMERLKKVLDNAMKRIGHSARVSELGYEVGVFSSQEPTPVDAPKAAENPVRVVPDEDGGL